MKAPFFAIVVSTALALTSLGETVHISQDVAAFDPQNPTKQLGTFKTGTDLEVDRSNPRSDGLVIAKYKPAQGNPVEALCKPSELFATVATAPTSPAKAPDGFGKSELFSKISSSLIDNEGKMVTKEKLERLRQSKYVLVYFSAHWCPPCRKFTPELVNFYNKQGETTQFETIFVSSDNESDAMKNYMKDTGMPWLAVRFNSARSTPLRKLAGRGIPCLVLLDENGEVLSHSYKGETYVGPHVPMMELAKRLHSSI